MTTAHINHLIQRTGRSLLWADVSVLLLRGVLVLVVVFALVVWLDAGYGFSPYLLLAMDGVLLVTCACLVWPVASRLSRGREGIRQTALTAESRLGISDNRLINAIDLSMQSDEGVSPSLRDKAIMCGEQVADALRDDTAVDCESLRRAATPVVVLVMVMVLIYVLMPGVYHAVLPRLFSPFADHPPYTRLRFDVRVEPEQVYVGKPAQIRVTLTWPGLPGQANVVFVDDGQKSPGLPMYRETLSAPPRPDVSADYTMRIDRVEQDRRFYIDTPKGRSRLYTLAVDRSPLIERARVTLRYPAYTGWPDATRPLAGRAIRGLAGTRVGILVNSNVPLGGGELHLTDTADTDLLQLQVKPVVPNTVDAHVAGVGFTLEDTGHFRLSLTGLDGTAGAEEVVGDVRVMPDRLPKVDVVSPDRQVVVPEGWPVEVTVGVGDDIGVSGAEVHVGLNDQPTKAESLKLSYTDADRTTGFADHAIKPDSLGAVAGDTVKYYAAAWDNRPVSPQISETPIHVVHVITMQQYMDLARSQYRVEDLQREFEVIQEQLTALAAQREALLEAMEAIQDRAGEDRALSAEQQEAVEALRKSLDKYARQSEALAQELVERAEQNSLYQFEEPYKEMLSKLSEQLQAQAQQSQSLVEAMKTLASGDTPEARQAAARAAEQFALMDEPFNQASEELAQVAQEDLERLALAEAMIRQGERIRRVVLEQADLAVRISGLAESQTLSAEQQQRAEELAQDQAALREELADAAGTLSVAAVKAGEALPNMSAGAIAIVDQIEGMGIVSTQRAAEKAARAGRGGMAHQAALKAAEDLDSLLSDSGPAMAGSSDLDGCFKLPREQMQNAMNQMMAGMGAGVPSMGMQGAGMSGAMARMAMMGPNVPGAPGESDAHGVRGDRRQTGNGRGIHGYVTEETGAGAEVIQAEAVTRFGDGVAVQPGVPVQYREQAEAYFKRIAEESR